VLAGVVAVAFLAVALAAGASGASPIRLIVNGREISPDVAPQLADGRTLVPIRWVAEALGADVQWDAKNRLVTINQPPDIWDDAVTIDAMRWVEVRSLLSRFYLARDWQDEASWKQVVTEDINIPLPVGGHYPSIVDWRILDGRMVDEGHIQLRVNVAREYYNQELYAYIEDVTVDMQQLRVSRVDTVERQELSCITFFNGLSLVEPKAGP